MFRGSSRQICLFDTTKDSPVQKITLDMSPAALTPHYDDDTKSPSPSGYNSSLLTNSVLFLWSKGSRQIHAYHLTTSPPALQLLPTFDGADLQSAVTFLPKRLVDVEKVEILQGLRLTSGNKIERFAFSIPRNRVYPLPSTSN